MASNSTVAAGYGVVAAKGLIPIANNTVMGNTSGATAFPSAIAISALTLDLDIGSTTITGGTTTRVLYDDAGILAEDSGLSFNKTTGRLSIGGPLTTGAGNSNIGGSLILSVGNVTVPAANNFNWLNSTRISSPGDGTIQIINSGSTAGGVIDVATDGTYKFFGRDGVTSAILSGASISLSGTVNSGAGGIYVNSGGNPVVALNGNANGDITSISGGRLGFVASATNANAAPDTMLTRKAAANFQLGAADAAAPVAQTISAQSVVAGTTNTAGAALTIAGSRGTGNANGGAIIFQIAFPGGSGSSQNALSNAVTINGAGTMAIGGAGSGNIKLRITGSGGGSTTHGLFVEDSGGNSNLDVYDNGNVFLGRPAQATTATIGWPQMPSSAGAPTGVPSQIVAGMCGFQYDTTNNKFWVYNGTAWKGVVLA